MWFDITYKQHEWIVFKSNNKKIESKAVTEKKTMQIKIDQSSEISAD
jgi:hypothetical protein